jgi:hypothetical protein
VSVGNDDVEHDLVVAADGSVPADQLAGFEADIKPLFRKKDRDSMLSAFDLWSYDDVKSHADAIAE